MVGSSVNCHTAAPAAHAAAAHSVALASPLVSAFSPLHWTPLSSTGYEQFGALWGAGSVHAMTEPLLGRTPCDAPSTKSSVLAALEIVEISYSPVFGAGGASESSRSRTRAVGVVARGGRPVAARSSQLAVYQYACGLGKPAKHSWPNSLLVNGHGPGGSPMSASTGGVVCDREGRMRDEAPW